MDFIEALFSDFSEIHGDRAFGDDAAMACGMAYYHGEPVMVIGNLKGRTLKERVARKFGSPDPEGYRKALRAIKIAEKYGRPIFTFIDLAGANPGIGAEERGQGEAIARNLIEMSRLRVPTITPAGVAAALAGLSLDPGAAAAARRQTDHGYWVVCVNYLTWGHSLLLRHAAGPRESVPPKARTAGGPEDAVVLRMVLASSLSPDGPAGPAEAAGVLVHLAIEPDVYRAAFRVAPPAGPVTTSRSRE